MVLRKLWGGRAFSLPRELTVIRELAIKYVTSLVAFASKKSLRGLFSYAINDLSLCQELR